VEGNGRDLIRDSFAAFTSETEKIPKKSQF
jgi:hypothetical protein